MNGAHGDAGRLARASPVWLVLCVVVAACGDDADVFVVSKRDAGADRSAGERPGETPARGAGDAGGVPVSSTQSVVVGSEDDDAGVGASDPAPGVDAPGEHACAQGPSADETDFAQDLGSASSTVLSGMVTGARDDGRFYVESPTGEAIGGSVRTDPRTGVYEVEVPLFCGDQRLKLVWPGAECDLVLVYEITTDACETDIRVTLTWDALGRDFELHLVREGGRINDDADDCTWTSCIGTAPDWGVLGDSRDDPTKDVDNTGNFGPENIVLERAPAGTYTVLVEHWGAGEPGADGELTINAGGRAPFVIRFFDMPSQWVFVAATIAWPGGEARDVGIFHDCAGNWSGGCRDPIP